MLLLGNKKINFQLLSLTLLTNLKDPMGTDKEITLCIVESIELLSVFI